MMVPGDKSQPTLPTIGTIRRELMLVVAAFLSAIGLVGSMHLDKWVAAWAAQPIALFRAISHELFFWLPHLTWITPELATLYLFFTVMILRGFFVEGTFRFVLQEFFLNEDTVGRITAIILSISAVIVFPVLTQQLIAYLGCVGSGQCSFHLWQILANNWLQILMYIYMAPAVFIAAPRSMSYFTVFLLILLAWGHFVASDPEKLLPMPDNRVAA